MFFANNTPLTQITEWANNQLSAVYSVAAHGIDIEIRPHKRQRSIEQNKFFMAIMAQLVKFYHETGFMPAGCQSWTMRTDIQKEYWKARFGIISTAKLSTAEFTKFIDDIQRTLVEETQGEWEIMTTDSAYLKSLGEL